MNTSLPTVPMPSPLVRWRPVIAAEMAILLVASFITVVDNLPFWRALLQGRDLSSPLTWTSALLTFVMLTAIHYVVLAVISTRKTLKAALCTALLLGAIVSHFISRYGIVIDTSMMRNVLQTDWHEASELVGVNMLATVLPLAFIPIGLLLLVNVSARPRRIGFYWRCATIAVAVFVAMIAAVVVFKDLAPTLRNRPEIRNMLTPANFVVSTGRALRQRSVYVAATREGPLAVARDAAAAAGRPLLFVFVVGETARAANFSLNGYPRDTNPELAKLDIINFPFTRACGTSTEVSLPCMFSPFGRRAYDEARILRHESLPQQLARAGIRVVWLDNQSGCKGVCSGLEVHKFDDVSVPGVCSSGHCFDEVLVQAMEELVRQPDSDLFVVLHQLGNHGPAYHRRYPREFRHFAPACESDDLHQCSQEQIFNAYDNAVRYTDHVLARVIGFLEQQRDRYEVAMVYVSDHGESLGEHGLYLHGMPYAIAPKEQLEVPMLWWMSPEFASTRNIDVACLRKRAGGPANHDYLFHSIAGVLDVQTPDREVSLDLFAACRGNAVARVASVLR